MSTPAPTPPGESAWLHAHPHEPNPAPSTTDPTLTLIRPDGMLATITLADLAARPQQSVTECYIVSTGHGTSGPFRFDGVTLADLLEAYKIPLWHYIDVISADGFGTRIQREEIQREEIQREETQREETQREETQREEIDRAASRPILLATVCNGEPLTRAQGLVRLIVPQETDDALRQVKWVARLEVH